MDTMQTRDPATGHVIVHVRREPGCEDLELPARQTDASAGVDLRAAVPEERPLTIAPGSWALVPTGLRVAIPEGFEGQVRPRSGLALKHGIGLLNAPGTIDADYRGPVGVILFNFSQRDFIVARGDRIAQLVLAQVEKIHWIPAETLPETGRGDGGFGHTG